MEDARAEALGRRDASVVAGVVGPASMRDVGGESGSAVTGSLAAFWAAVGRGALFLAGGRFDVVFRSAVFWAAVFPAAVFRAVAFRVGAAVRPVGPVGPVSSDSSTTVLRPPVSGSAAAFFAADCFRAVGPAVF
jgi:hypothetical protein